jgi:glycosyltransferase involved in cell wall biosynthesis
MIEGLRQAGVEVIECHEALWHGIEDRVQLASGGWRSPKVWARIARTYARVVVRYANVEDHDLVVVGYPGQFDVFLARLLCFVRNKPLAWDVFMSIYLISLERGLDKRSKFTVDMLRRIERAALRTADLLIHDTFEYAKWLASKHGVSPEAFHLVPTGADDRVYRPVAPAAAMQEPRPFRVLYFGTFIPNHGIRYVLEAARYLKKVNVEFELVGEGPEREMALALVREYQLTNVSFKDWLSSAELSVAAARADVVLGAFGTTPQSLMTVQNKIYEGLAMARPVITGDSPAVRDSLRHGEQVYVCARADGLALAQAIDSLREQPELRSKLAEQGHRVFRERYALRPIGVTFRSHLEGLLERRTELGQRREKRPAHPALGGRIARLWRF